MRARPREATPIPRSRPSSIAFAMYLSRLQGFAYPKSAAYPTGLRTVLALTIFSIWKLWYFIALVVSAWRMSGSNDVNEDMDFLSRRASREKPPMAGRRGVCSHKSRRPAVADALRETGGTQHERCDMPGI